ncbi:MAG: hypothetical protein AAGA57_09345 [Planctomycetota bacterium]
MAQEFGDRADDDYLLTARQRAIRIHPQQPSASGPSGGSILDGVGFQGLFHDEDLGDFVAGGALVHNRARTYVPELGRFAQRDPLGYPDGLSAYAAYHVMRGGVDPSGMQSDQWIVDKKLHEGGSIFEGMDHSQKPLTVTEEIILDAIGVVDPTPTTDLAHGALLADEGRLDDAALTTAGVIPVLGDAWGKGTKWAKRALGGMRDLFRRCPPHKRAVPPGPGAAPPSPDLSSGPASKPPPKPPKEFLPPTNPPRNPPRPEDLPPGHTIRESPPNEMYPHGYWKQYNERGQPVNPSTGRPPSNVTRPEARAETHVPKPPPEAS